MAKTIKGSEIIEDGHLKNAITQAETLKKVYTELDAQIKKTASTAKSGLGGVNPNSAQGIQKINAEVQKSINLKKQSKTVTDQLRQAEDLEVKAKLKLAEATRIQKKEIRETIKLENAEAGSLNKLSLQVKKYEQELRKLNLTTVSGRKRQQELITKINQSNAVFKKNSSALSAQRINIGNYSSALKGATGSLRSFAGALGLTSGIFLLAQGLKSSIGLIIDFEQANANLASILGTTKEGINELTEDAKRLGEATANTASEITQLQTELAKLGFTRQEILDSTGAIQQLAQATGTDLAQSATQVGSALRIFGLEATESQRVVDVLSASTSKSALDMSKLATALPIVGTTASVAGLSIERTTGLLGVLSDRGIDASTSGTGLRKIFLELAKSGQTWDEAMTQINESTNKNKTAVELFGVRSATMGVILAENSAQADELTKALEMSGGTAKEMADTQLDTLAGALKLLKSAYEGFILSLANGNGALSGLKVGIKFLANNFRTIVKVLGLVIKTFISFKAVMLSLKMADRIKEFRAYNKTVGKSGSAMSEASVKAKAFGKALKGIGMAVAITLLIELAVAFYDIASGAAEARRQQDLFNKAQENSSKFGKEFNDITDEKIKNKTKELELLVAEGKLTKEQMDLQIRDLQIQKEKNALKIVKRSQDRIKLLKEENRQLRIKADIDSENIKNNSNLRGFEKIERENNLRRILNAEIKINNGQIVQQNEIIKEFSNIANDTNDTIHDYTVNIADNSGKLKRNTADIEDNTKAIKKRSEEIRKIDIEEAKKRKLALDLVEDGREDPQIKIDERLEAEKKAQEELVAMTKKMFDDLNNILQLSLQSAVNNIDSQIEKGNNRITDSETRINDLKQQAQLGNLDAQESVKAEKQAIANERENIEALEKKKRNLLILVTGLNLANQKIQAGDGSGLESAGSEIKGFVDKLKGFYKGTETTLGADLGNAYAISGDKDTHIIKAHKDEHIIGVENSRKLGNMKQSDIVKGALMLKNGEFVGRRAINAVNSIDSYNDSRMVDAIAKNTQAIQNIQIPEHKFNYDALSKIATETIRIGNKTINNHKPMF